jgi:hypothetical protein
VRRQLARWLRKKADRLDNAGAPKRTSWHFTFEEGWGLVFNDRGRGCPLWYVGDDSFRLAHDHAGDYGKPEDVEWVTLGTRTDDGVHVLGSAEARNVRTTRRSRSYTTVGVPVRATAAAEPSMRAARVPEWVITLTCEMHSFVTLHGKTYPEAVQDMFRRAGIRG